MHFDLVLAALQEIAPLEYAESWDNVGLLVGNRQRPITSAMTCLTLTASTLQEAIAEHVDLVVCHHPIPFKPLSRITSDTTTGNLLLRAIESGIAIYSPHTAWDNAKTGINQQLAEILGLESTCPLKVFDPRITSDCEVGIGRCGLVSNGEPKTLGGFIERIRVALPNARTRHTHTLEHPISKVGIACGSGGSLLGLLQQQNCDTMLTGEATYHQCLEAEAQGIAMILIGHHASEFFAMKSLALQMQNRLPGCKIFTSSSEASRF
jgi:dinuclear metal center YbgI/SA1388 family protein